MQMRDYLKSASTQVRYCSSRPYCPIGRICEQMTCESEEYPLYPTIVKVERGRLAWTDPLNEQRVFVIKSGVLASISSLEHEKEIPFALLGCGDSAGLGELYIPRFVGQTYYIKALADSTLCSFPAKPLRRRLESFPPEQSLTAVSCSLTNLSSAAYCQLKTVSRPLLSDRLALIFFRLKDLAKRDRLELSEIKLTHEDLATLTSSDRTSVTRALRKMEEGGLIELGYRRIRFLPALDSLEALRSDAFAQFHAPDTE